MRRGLHTSGFTIVEILIFLAVSSLLLVGAFSLITGQQARTEFSQSIRDIQTQIDDVINTVASGYYATTADFECHWDIAGPQITALSKERGTNQGCIFVGRAMQFVVDSGSFKVDNIIGLQYKDNVTKTPATSLADAKPVLHDPSDDRTLLYGLKTRWIKYEAAGTGTGPVTDTNTAAFISSLGTPNVASSGLVSGSQTVDIYAATTLEKADQVAICFEGGINEAGLITIGSNNRQLSTKLEIKSTTKSSTGCA